MSRYPWRNTSEDIADQSKSQWETPGGAQAKADAAQQAAEKYSDDKLSAHVGTGGNAHALVKSNGDAGFMSGTDKKKLDGIDDGANKYVHPLTHPPSIIAQDSNNRFVTDAQISNWDKKAPADLVTQTVKGLMSPEDKAKFDKSTNGMTPDTLMMRDAGGRAKVAPPSASNDIARKQEVDTVQTNLDTHAANADMHTTAAEHQKLKGIEEGAEVNQNAFSNINGIEATKKMDSIKFKNGTGITITTNPSNNEVIFTSTGESTPGKHGDSHNHDGADPIPDLVATMNEVSGMKTDVDEAVAQSTTASTNASNALTKADEAKAQAASAESKSDQAISKANDANSKAETASTEAETALTNSSSALSKAGEALNKANDAKTTADSVMGNYTRFSGWGDKTGGTAPNFTLTLNPAPATIPDGFGVSFQVHADADAPTLNINGKGAAPVLDKPGGKPVKFESGRIYTVRKSGTDFLLDSGSASGGAAGIEVEAFYGGAIDVGDPVVGYMYKSVGYEEPFDVSFQGYVNDVATGGNIVVFAFKIQPYIAFYYEENGEYKKLPNPATMPGGAVQSVDVTNDGRIIVAGGDDGLKAYQLIGKSLQNLSIPSPPTSSVGSVGVSRVDVCDGKVIYLAYSTGNSVYGRKITINDSNGFDLIELLNTPGSQPDKNVNRIYFISKNSFAVLPSIGSTGIRLYKIDGSDITYVDHVGGSAYDYRCGAIRPSGDFMFISATNAAGTSAVMYSINISNETLADFTAISGASTDEYYRKMFFTKNNDYLYAIRPSTLSVIYKYKVKRGRVTSIEFEDVGECPQYRYTSGVESPTSNMIILGKSNIDTGTSSTQCGLVMAPYVTKGMNIGKYMRTSVVGVASESGTTGQKKTIKRIATF